MNQLMLPNFSISRNYLNLLKWFALIAMTVFHFNYAFRYDIPEYIVLFGRLAFPIFAFVLAYNIAQSQINGYALESKIIRLLLVFGCFAQPFYWALVYSPLPLNILFSLALGVFITYHYKQASAWLVLVFFGYFVDYVWAGPLLVLLSYFVAKDLLEGKTKARNILLLIFGLSAVAFTTDSFYPFLFLPLLWFGHFWKPDLVLPRYKWLFYSFYPVHLVVIQILKYFHINLF